MYASPKELVDMFHSTTAVEPTQKFLERRLNIDDKMIKSIERCVNTHLPADLNIQNLTEVLFNQIKLS
jgi:hypothetical protein